MNFVSRESKCFPRRGRGKHSDSIRKIKEQFCSFKRQLTHFLNQAQTTVNLHFTSVNLLQNGTLTSSKISVFNYYPNWNKTYQQINSQPVSINSNRVEVYESFALLLHRGKVYTRRALLSTT